MLLKVLINASKILSGPKAKSTNSAKEKNKYVKYSTRPVSENLPPIFSSVGPVASAEAITCPLIPSAGKMETKSTRIPIPPSQLETDFHKSSERGIVAKSKTEQPVVVKPATDSKKLCEYKFSCFN